MTENELRRRFPGASSSTIRRNQTGGAPSSTKPEQVILDDPMGPAPGKESDPGRVHVRVVSFRKQLIDPDNLCPKFFIDCLRYAGLIRDDRAQDIALEVSQTKVNSKDEERTEITLWRKTPTPRNGVGEPAPASPARRDELNQ